MQSSFSLTVISHRQTFILFLSFLIHHYLNYILFYKYCIKLIHYNGALWPHSPVLWSCIAVSPTHWVCFVFYQTGMRQNWIRSWHAGPYGLILVLRMELSWQRQASLAWMVAVDLNVKIYFCHCGNGKRDSTCYLNIYFYKAFRVKTCPCAHLY